MSVVLDYILRTNLFNFIIFAGIIAFLCVKLDVSGVLEKGKAKVKETVEASEDIKEQSESHLSEIEARVANLQNEVDEIISKAAENAELVGNQIINDANNAVAVIKENTEKLVENKTALLRNDVMKRAALASIEVAKKHIISELDNNYDLHLRLIDESLDELNNLEEVK